MPIVEFVWWPATHEFLSDIDAVISPTVDHISSAAGCLGSVFVCFTIEHSAPCNPFLQDLLRTSGGRQSQILDGRRYCSVYHRSPPALQLTIRSLECSLGEPRTPSSHDEQRRLPADGWAAEALLQRGTEDEPC